MTTQTAPAPGFLRDVIALSKPRVTALVLCTTAGGVWLAPGSLSWSSWLLMLAATALVVGAANTLNCYLERGPDGLMKRTRNRPLPAGRLAPLVALRVGIGLGIVSVPLLAVVVNPLTALLSAVALLSYVLIYTPLKQQTPVALLVGAIPGAIPPLMGWTAVTGSLELPGLLLFGILFVWQIPHFLAIAIFRNADYTYAGFRTYPVAYGERRTRIHLAAWATLLLPVSILPYAFGLTGLTSGVVAAVLGVAYMVLAWTGLRASTSHRWARSVFIASIIHLTVLFTVLMVDAV